MAPTSKEALHRLVTAHGGEAATAEGTVARALQIIRAHLGMDVAYVSEFVDGRSVFREVDAPGHEALIKIGDSQSLDDVYCRDIVEGRLPQLMPDTAKEPRAAAMPITRAVPIGAHISVPLVLPDGRIYGMFCCLAFAADETLRDRDLRMLRAFADLAAFEISRELEAKRAHDERVERIRAAIDGDRFAVHYQPIWDLEADRPIGMEALSRFQDAAERGPDAWFAEAAEVGLAEALEIAAVRKALTAFAAMPEGEGYIAVNVSPETAIGAALPAALAGMPLDRIVLEITEHAHVADYDLLVERLKPLRARGLGLAVDDAGAGYASFQHILQLKPDLIKLDMGLTRNIDRDPARQALASALIQFVRETGSRIVAEGVETVEELAMLRSLGVVRAQGYLLGRPEPLEAAVRRFGEKAVQRPFDRRWSGRADGPQQQAGKPASRSASAGPSAGEAAASG